MIAAVALGVRLAWGSPGRRVRSLSVLAASAVGTSVLLAVWAIATSRVGSTGAFSDQEVGRLIAGVVAAVALPVVVLAATVGRLSAQLRDRQLANLRLLGLSAAQTRTVAAAEAGLVAVVGTALGAALTVALAWVRGTDLVPSPAACAAVILGLPAVTVAVAVLPQRLDLRRALDRARKSDVRRPSPWRAAPLGVGLVLCLLARRANNDFMITGSEVATVFAGLALVSLGIILVVPVFVRLLADLLARGFSGPTAMVAARRLQAQPAATTRVIAALMVGLFLLVGARSVVVAFEETPQYAAAADHIENGQRAAVTVPAGGLDAARRDVLALPGVRDTFAFPVLTGEVTLGAPGDPVERVPVAALVAGCDELRRFAPAVDGCVDGVVSSLTPRWVPRELGGTGAPDTAALWSGTADAPAAGAVEVPISEARITGTGEGSLDEPTWDIRPLWADLLVPPGTPGVESLTTRADTTLVVVAGPGRDLYQQLDALGLTATTREDIEYYDFVAGMRTVIWTLAAVVLSIGLLTFAVAAGDRAVARRRELTSLLLVGTPPTLLRRAQWLEAALPTALGCVAAIVSGLFAGSTYLQLGSDMGDPPWQQSALLLGIAVLASAAVAGVTVIGVGSRLKAEHIRAE
ncbi:FtsX-like permease family protein [Jiangella asiatica]|uniref:ABC transporter permease n=1 Tax=Jiangella asiatica TaxID=2530372 RepID=A0A4R5DSF3_9ACTN|nr:FtsX-like permease family protein [Jiangella asiatica]TDE14045.1 ABC transporter permease [Jiangella asiatica]